MNISLQENITDFLDHDNFVSVIQMDLHVVLKLQWFI